MITTSFFGIVTSPTQSFWLRYRAIDVTIDHINLTPIVAFKSAILHLACQKHLC